MTREILFRGKDVDNGEWVYGSYLQRYNHSIDDGWLEYYIVDDLGYEYEVIPETVGQFTGLKDKNGTKIFDGDKVLIDNEIGNVKNYILKAQAQEKELAELKKTVKAFIDNHVAYPYDEDGVAYDDEYTKDYEKLLELCKGSEER